MSAKLFRFILLLCDIVTIWKCIYFYAPPCRMHKRAAVTRKQLTQLSHIEFVIYTGAKTHTAETRNIRGSHPHPSKTLTVAGKHAATLIVAWMHTSL